MTEAPPKDERDSEHFKKRKQQFWKWHQANPRIWAHFEFFAYEMQKRGARKISHWLVINRIRWETYTPTTGDEFKISNDLIAFYARLWRALHPEAKHLFNIKQMRGEPPLERPGKAD